MYETNEFRKGLRIEIDGHPYIMVENQFVKPGKGQAFNRVKIKSLLNGNVIERTYKSGEKVAKADVSDQTMQFLYEEGGIYHFMDEKTFEQIGLQKDQIGDLAKWIQEGMKVDICLYQGEAVSCAPPNFVTLEITYCEPAVRGDTATNVTKEATVSTGATIQVPAFIQEGDKVRIDTRTGSYMDRVNK